ncbi:hypothetical protein MBEHAL_1315 [Halarchaeum acidiphilum MH1-52-1]|uniref:Uncharacterized protein n=1 Tax=Halarchaeum acidiphilum MH1-52-1 TaxID=1261545 RepID=U2YU69_9EURY|nr:hypothetical protein MBEHAL_1315 [Halarchaeum acidiphilum MH1-52-1]
MVEDHEASPGRPLIDRTDVCAFHRFPRRADSLPTHPPWRSINNNNNKVYSRRRGC